MKVKKEYEGLRIYFDSLHRSITVSPENYTFLKQKGYDYMYVKSKKKSSEQDTSDTSRKENG